LGGLLLAFLFIVSDSQRLEDLIESPIVVLEVLDLGLVKLALILLDPVDGVSKTATVIGDEFRIDMLCELASFVKELGQFPERYRTRDSGWGNGEIQK
jgi:hypothetical protein